MKLPHHVAIVMDGNGRWAQQRGLSRADGHREGIKAAQRTVEACCQRGISKLTLFAFSTENWRRPPAEIASLLKLMAEGFSTHLSAIDDNDVRVTFAGDISRFSAPLRKQIRRMEASTQSNRTLDLRIALNYSGRWDIVQATRRIVESGAASSELTEERFEQALMIQPADLIIRTSGEMRLSNFLLWQAAYAELHFCPLFWPDFGMRELDQAIEDYASRERRYGGIAQAYDGAEQLYG